MPCLLKFAYAVAVIVCGPSLVPPAVPLNVHEDLGVAEVLSPTKAGRTSRHCVSALVATVSVRAVPVLAYLIGSGANCVQRGEA